MDTKNQTTRRSEKASEVQKKYTIEADKLVAFSCRIVLLILALVLFIDSRGLAAVMADMHPMVLLTGIILLLPTLFYNVLKLNSTFIRYFMLLLLIFMCGVLYAVFSIHAVIMLIFPVVMACLYCDRKSTTFTAIAGIPIIILAHAGAYIIRFIPEDPLISSNMITKAVALRLVEYVTLSVICILITSRIQHLIEKLVGMNTEMQMQTDELRHNKEIIENMSEQTLKTLAYAIDAKDEYTHGHSIRVAGYAVILARALGMSEEEIEILRMAALLHDIGKIGVPDSILNKQGMLTDLEYDVVRSHTTMGYRIMKNVANSSGADIVAKYHHERYDGKGYPDGLRGEEIPLHARIIGIVDAYDAMLTKRVYRKELPREVVRQEIINGRGTQFDPIITDVFLKLFDENLLKSDETEISMPEELKDTNDLLQFVLTTTDEQTKQSEKMDALTGVYSRSHGEKLISEVMQEEDGYLAFIDLDNLKVINDLYGHLAGDRALQALGNILTKYSDDSIACRLGGDEFLCFLPGMDKAATEQRIMEMLNEYDALKSKDASLKQGTLSVGLSASRAGSNFSEVSARADKALYHVKQNGKAGYFFYKNMHLDGVKVSATDLSNLVEALHMAGDYNGAMNLEYRAFTRLYGYVNNLDLRYHYGYTLIMISLEEAEDAHLYIDELETAMVCMEKTIRNVVRGVDVCTRFSNMQFLVILVGTGDENVKKITDRVFNEFRNIYKSQFIKPTYAVAKVKKREKA